MNRERMAVRIEKKADMLLRRAIRTWGPRSSDPDKEMVTMIARDKRDMYRVAKMVRRGASALHLDNFLWRMDTAARDEFPAPFINWLNKEIDADTTI